MALERGPSVACKGAQRDCSTFRESSRTSDAALLASARSTRLGNSRPLTRGSFKLLPGAGRMRPELEIRLATRPKALYTHLNVMLSHHLYRLGIRLLNGAFQGRNNISASRYISHSRNPRTAAPRVTPDRSGFSQFVSSFAFTLAGDSCCVTLTAFRECIFVSFVFRCCYSRALSVVRSRSRVLRLR